MDTRPDPFSPDAQTFYDLEYAQRILEEERTQLAAAKIALALAVEGLLDELEIDLTNLALAISRHERTIEVVTKVVSTPTGV